MLDSGCTWPFLQRAALQPADKRRRKSNQESGNSGHGTAVAAAQAAGGNSFQISWLPAFLIQKAEKIKSGTQEFRNKIRQD
jgi:hypothetical protein